jgi:(p)ppGpp synthase/HD superfamily hydrolase
MTAITSRYSAAVEYARDAHAKHFRKGTSIPYLYHLLGVSSMVLEYGGNEDQAIAGLLHDVLEDCGDHHEALIRQQFGEAVITIVLHCTDGTAGAKGEAKTQEAKFHDWQRRKTAYLAHLAETPATSLLVSACDKLHNARAILSDIQGDAGLSVFDRFTARRDGTLQYYESLSRIFLKHSAVQTPRFHELAREFDRTVARMHELSGASARVALG